MNQITPQDIHYRLKTDLPYYSVNFLHVQSKGIGVVPLALNTAQLYIHKRLEDQLAKTGKVRALILKGRQQGCSTYVGARFFHKTLWNSDLKTYILTHHSTTTEELFGLVEKFYAKLPSSLKPQLTTNNQKRMEFGNGSRYLVGTAKAGQTGRGSMNHLFHGSEVAFWESSDGASAGVLQSIPDAPGTEIILESTANGVGNFFHQRCMAALEGNSDFQLIFVPWYWQEEYTRPYNPETTALTEEEQELLDIYPALTPEHLIWRRAKIQDIGDTIFKQEYPFNEHEAFQMSGERLLSGVKVEAARLSRVTDPLQPVVIGVDPARSGDRTAIVMRRGREVFEVQTYTDMDEMRLAGILAKLIDRYQAKACFIDVALGRGTADRLNELGYSREVQTVHFGSKPFDPERFLNKRVEMAFELKQWIEDTDLGEVSIPDNPDLIKDLMAIPLYKVNSSGRIQLEAKEDIKKKLGMSPDLFDALILTFAYPVHNSLAGQRRASISYVTKLNNQYGAGGGRIETKYTTSYRRP